MDFSQPGKSGDNAINEAFNGSVRRECILQHYFLDVGEARRVLETWREDYNNERLHGSLAQLPPASFRASWDPRKVPSKLQDLPA
jgi:putative transposase